jgi:hypothetical protein
VISGPGDRIGSGASKVTILLNPIEYAITPIAATIAEGDSGTTPLPLPSLAVASHPWQVP